MMIMSTRKILAIASVVGVSILSSTSAAYSLGLTLIPTTSFNVSVSGSFDNNVASTSVLNTDIGLNTAGGVDSFNNFFTSNFLSVGALATDQISTSLAEQNSSVRTGILFNINAATIASTPTLQTKFNFILRGTADDFQSVPQVLIQLLRFTSPTTFVIAGTVINRSPASGSGLYQIDEKGAFTSNITLTTAGDYGYRVTLTEPTGGSGSDNQAAGFNQFTAETIPFNFDPSAGIAILGAGFGLNKLRKNLKAKKETKV